MIPRSLAALLAAVAVAEVAWVLLVPPFMVPDEAEHFAYVQSLAESGERPPRGGSADLPYSTDLRVAVIESRTTRFIADRRLKPAWEPGAERRWRAFAPGLARDDIRSLPAQSERGPIYYAYEVVPYTAASGGNLFHRFFAMRLWSALLLLVTTAAVWCLIGELTGKDRLLQLAGAACAGLQPMVGFTSSGVHPDSLLFASFAVALWLAVRVVARGPTAPSVAGLVGATLVAGLTKPAGLALVPALALVLVVLARRDRRTSRIAIPGALACGAAVLAAGLAVERGVGKRTPVDLSPETLRGFATYMWDFYLPRLPFQHEYAPLTIDNPAWTVWVKHAWGSFGFLEVQFPRAVYVVLAAVAAAALVTGGLAVARGRFPLGRLPLAILGLTAASLVIGLHWADFQAVNGGDGRVIQGRHLLPLMPVVGVAVAAALSHLRDRRAYGAALVLAGMAALQLASLATVAGRYFA